MRTAVAGASGTVGRHVVAALRSGGHDVVALSRSDGVDLTAGAGLAEALDGVQVVIDAANSSTIERMRFDPAVMSASARAAEDCKT